MNGERTHAGKSSSKLIVIIRHHDSILPDPPLTPLKPEPMTVRGARQWIDAGMPDNTRQEYAGWVK